MFPDYEPKISIENNETETSVNGKSFLFDFSTGDFIVKDGKMQVTEGLEALKVWVQKILKTEKFKFKIYETGEVDEYGATLLDLVNSGHSRAFIQAEIQREITEALKRNSEILSIDSFNFSRDKRTLIVNFEVNSIYGTIEQEVSF